MKPPDTPPAKSAKSALSTPPALNADNADNAGELSEKINEVKTAGLDLTAKLCEVSMTLAECGYQKQSARALRQYFRAVELYLSVGRNLEGLP